MTVMGVGATMDQDRELTEREQTDVHGSHPHLVGGGKASDVEIVGVGHQYTDTPVLHDVDLFVHHGEFLTLLGPSGSGKSTLLRIVGGLELPRTGAVKIGTEDVTGLPPERREIGVVFQNYALFPHMTVADNISFPLRMRKMGRKDARARVSEMLELVDLAGMESRRPGELSGGQQQRVALARALVFEPRVLLLDEPFGALDRRLREQLGLAVRRVQRELGITTIFVTHDQDEAFTMSNRIAVMSSGRILQVDAPGDVYRAPATLKVARLLGQLNEFPMEVVERNGVGALLAGAAGHRVAVAGTGELAVGRRVRCGVRPEHVRVATREDETCRVRARVLAGIFGGTWTRAQLEVADSAPVMALLPPHASLEFSDGDEVWFGFNAEHGILFDEATERRLA